MLTQAPLVYILLFVVGSLAGVLSGLFGIGGGVVIVPILVFVLGFSQQTASGTSLIALLLPVGILGVFEYYKAGKIGLEHIKYGLFIALGLFLGAYFGAKLSIDLPESLLKKGFSVLLAFVALKMWFGI